MSQSYVQPYLDGMLTNRGIWGCNTYLYSSGQRNEYKLDQFSRKLIPQENTTVHHL